MKTASVPKAVSAQNARTCIDECTTHLSLRGSTIESLPPYFKQLQNLKSLDLSSTKNLWQLPMEIGDLVNLEKLNLSRSVVLSLPPSNQLDVSETEDLLKLIRFRPKRFSIISCFPIKFILHRFERASFTNCLGRLKNLKDLDLSFAKNVFVLPKEIGDLVHLEKMNLRGSGIKSLPPSIGCLQNLRDLDLFLTKLLKLPEEIGNLTNLNRLNLRRTCIALLPTSIGCLKNLKYLNLSCTRNLMMLPEEIGNLTNLNELNLRETTIKSLPLSTFHLENLEHLGISSTNMSTLPDEIGLLVSLKKLNLSGSNFAKLPSSIRKLQNLTHLNLSRTSFCHDSLEEIGNIVSLNALDLSRTSITSLPKSLYKITDLMYLNLYKTPVIMESKNAFDFVMKLVSRHRSLGSLGDSTKGLKKDFYWRDEKDLKHALELNKAWSAIRAIPNMWPHVLRYWIRTKSRCWIRVNFRGMRWATAFKRPHIFIHKFLQHRRMESFVEFLVDRNNRVTPAKMKTKASPASEVGYMQYSFKE